MVKTLHLNKLTVWFSALVLVFSLSMIAFPKAAQAAPVAVPTLGDPGYSLSVCKFDTNYKGLVVTKIRAIFSKPAGTDARVADLTTWGTANTGTIYAKRSSSTWWGDTVTVVETPASYWWSAGVDHNNADGGFTSYMWTALYATAYTPWC